MKNDTVDQKKRQKY